MILDSKKRAEHMAKMREIAKRNRELKKEPEVKEPEAKVEPEPEVKEPEVKEPEEEELEVEEDTIKDSANDNETWERIKKMAEENAKQQTEGENDTMKQKIEKKIKIKLGRFGQTIADSEQFVFYKYDLNNVMSDAEVEAERQETKEDVDLLIENRLKIVSEFGDIINVVIDIFSHIATRAMRIYGNKKGNNNTKVNANDNSGLANDLGISREDLDKLLKGGVIK